MGQSITNTVFTALSTDVVVFTIQDDRLLVLLVRRRRRPYAGSWALPGGLVPEDEGLDECARRMLGEKAGVRGVYLEQLYSFGAPQRDPRGRVVSVAYYALVPPNRVQLEAMAEDAEREWVPVDNLPELAFDHFAVVSMAHQRLAAKLAYSTIALQFMPEKFTLSELQSVYEIILGESLDKRNFRKRVLALPCIEDTGECFRAGKHRPAKLYRVNTPGRVEIIK
ncbi:MAG: NUDIX domain-containing protein [Aquisalimonadaceae bacterium]